MWQNFQLQGFIDYSFLFRLLSFKKLIIGSNSKSDLCFVKFSSETRYRVCDEEELRLIEMMEAKDDGEDDDDSEDDDSEDDDSDDDGHGVEEDDYSDEDIYGDYFL